MNDWKIRHYEAVQHPTSGIERGLVGIITGVEETLLALDYWPDSVGTPAVGEILSGFLTLLNFTTGRLDAGLLDSWARDVAAAAGWDLDMEQIIWKEDE